MDAIKVMIIDDHPTVRMGIGKLLESKEDIEICGEAGSVNDAMSLIERTTPDVILVDIALEEEMSGIDFIRVVSRRYPQINMLVHSMYDESVYAERAIRAGAKGYIQKNEAPQKILSGIRGIMNGELILSDRIKDRIINKMIHGGAGDPDKSSMDVLSNREFEIFQLFGKGYNIKEIAKILNLSTNTVETHRRNIREKLNLESNNQLIKSAVEWVSVKRG